MSQGKNAVATPDLAPSGPPAGREMAMVLVALAVLAIALLQAVVPSAPDVYWDIDPRSQLADKGRVIVTVLTPAMLAALQAAMLALSAVGLYLHAMSGPSLNCLGVCGEPGARRVRQSWRCVQAMPTLLALTGIGFTAYHVARGGPHAQPGAQWMAGAAGAVALLHLAQNDAVRRWVLASTVAMLVPLALKAVWFVHVEHAETLKMFLADKERFLAERGWTEDSPNAQIFIRRMSDPEAAGAYGLSNVFGSVIAALTAMAAVIALGLILRARRQPGASRWAAAGLMALASLAGVYGAYLSRSKGAFAAMVAAVGVAAVWAFFHARFAGDPADAADAARRLRARSRWGWATAAAATLLVAFAFFAVVARGHFPPPPATGGGERSLFFRSQYFDAAWKILQTSPRADVARGVGPAGFQAVYQRAKDPSNPEEVMSTHNVWIDWIAMLGVGGLAWSLLLLWMIWRAGRGAGEGVAGPRATLDDEDRPSAIGRFELLLAGAMTAAIFFTQNRVQIDLFMPSTAALWLLCMGGYVIFCVMLASENGWLAKLGWPWAAAAAFTGALVLLIHAQIEMTFFNPGGSVLAWLLVAAAAGAGTAAMRERWRSELAATGEPPSPSATRRVVAFHRVVLTVLLAASLAFAWGPVRRTFKVQSHLEAASTKLRAGDPAGAAAQLQAARDADPADADIWRSWAVTRWEWSEALRQRGQAAQADAIMKENEEQLRHAFAADGPTPEECKLIRGLADQLEHVDFAPEPGRLERATKLREEVAVRLNPFGIEDRLRYAKLLDRRGLRDEAASAYRQTLELSDHARLDPAKQLAAGDRAAVEKRLAELAGK